MAYDDGESNWADDDRYYSSGRSSDDSPILERNPRHRRGARRTALTVLAKFFLFSTAMILFCVLMYLPVYGRARYNSRAMVEGWSIDTSRDTKLYIRPNNLTVLHEPKTICPKDGSKLFLLMVVTSATSHTNIRNSIRSSYGNYSEYLKLSKLFHEVTEEHKSCLAFDKELGANVINNNCTKLTTTEKPIEEIKGFNDLLPQLEKSFREKLKNYTPGENEEKKPDAIATLNMEKELGEYTTQDYNNYDYDTNVMKIPPIGEEQDDIQVNKILNVLSKVYNQKTEDDIRNVEKPDFKIVFLVGKPTHKNKRIVEREQMKINAEIKVFDDIIQEDFLDTYYNLTLKSIMMLKWVTNNCDNAVRYILKADDDMYFHLPHLVDILREKARIFDQKVTGPNAKEYLMLGHIMAGAKPLQNIGNKWFSPKYMYSGRFYPSYLSGVGYIMSYDAAKVIYKAALETRLFHLEDIFITGICTSRASPPLRLRSHPAIVYRSMGSLCDAHSYVFTKLYTHMEKLHRKLLQRNVISDCEKLRLIRVRDNLRKAKEKLKKLQNRHPVVVR